ncbi:hypothetical protein SHIRM173S_11792 [Streptomyces hirsutus]
MVGLEGNGRPGGGRLYWAHARPVMGLGDAQRAPVVILVLAFSTAGPMEHSYVLLGEITLELAIGAAIGLTVGWLGSLGLRHVALPASGLYPIAVMAIAVTAYAAGAMAHGSGFLAVSARWCWQRQAAALARHARIRRGTRLARADRHVRPARPAGLPATNWATTSCPH